MTNGTRTIADGLRGLHIVVASNHSHDTDYLRQGANGELKGFEKEILDLMSLKGGFTYEFKHYVMGADETWTQFLRRMADECDLVTFSWWTITTERERLGLVSPYGFQDQSPILVQLEPEPRATPFLELVFQFGRPFTASVWALFMTLAVVSATVYWFIERDYNKDDAGGPRLAGLLNSIYLTVVLWSGGGGPTPVRPPAKFLLMAWSFVGLLTISAYTANLASFLIARPVPPPLFQNVNDLMSQSKVVCIADSKQSGQLFLSKTGYTRTLNVNPGYPFDFQALSNKKCDAVVSTVMQLQRRVSDVSIADRCKLRNVGMPMGDFAGGWMIKLDYFLDCKMIVRDTLRYYFLDFATDGTLEKIMQNTIIDRHNAPPCTTSDKTQEDNLALDISSMAGIILIQVVAMLISLMLYCCEQHTPKRVACHVMSHSPTVKIRRLPSTFENEETFAGLITSPVKVPEETFERRRSQSYPTLTDDSAEEVFDEDKPPVKSCRRISVLADHAVEEVSTASLGGVAESLGVAATMQTVIQMMKSLHDKVDSLDGRISEQDVRFRASGQQGLCEHTVCESAASSSQNDASQTTLQHIRPEISNYLDALEAKVLEMAGATTIATTVGKNPTPAHAQLVHGTGGAKSRVQPSGS